MSQAPDSVDDVQQPAAARSAAGRAPARFDVFLSYNSNDHVAVERIARHLRRARIEPWLDRWSLTPGGEWQRELGAGLDASGACAVFVGAHDLGAWELQEVVLAIDRAARQPGFRVFPVLLPGVEEPFDPNALPHFLRARTWVDFRRGHEDPRALQDLVNAVRGVPFGSAMPVERDAGVAPYRGLRAFGEADARFFFGRDREVQRLVERLKRSRFVAVLGPSGSGKSSLVRAGLVPRLRGGALSDVARWHVLQLRPGAAPLTALAAQLAKLTRTEALQATLDRLARDPRTLHLCAELALADSPPDERVLVLVDQLEEVFTICRDERERRQLFATLLHAVSAAGGRVVVIATMRSDFYGRCAPYPELAQLVSAEQMLVGPMHADALRQAIEEPARSVGLELESGLTNTILADADAGTQPGALPLLEHALLELWERRSGTMLTLEAYRRTGGVRGALAQRADEIFDELSPAQQRIARRMLLRLTQPGEGTGDTRRRATPAELAPDGAAEDFHAVLGRLVDARMLTTGRDETGEEVVDVSHEALIRGWPRLRGWIDADRAGLLTHRRMTDAAREWAALGREAGALYRGLRLASAREWAREHPDDLSRLEREFLESGSAAEQRELLAGRRRARRQRALAAGLAVLAVVVTALTVWVLDERGDARRQGAELRRAAADSTSRELAAVSTRLLGPRTDLSLLFGLEAYRESELFEARSSLLAALVRARRQRVLAILRGHAEPIVSVASSPDGRTLASADREGTIRLWDARSHKPLGAPIPAAAGVGGLQSIALSPREPILAASGEDGVVRFWDLRTHAQLRRPHPAQPGFVASLAFSPDGRRLATGGLDRAVHLWDVGTGEQVGRLLLGHQAAVLSVAFSPDGRSLASAGADGTVRLWDLRDHRQIGRSMRGDGTPIGSVAFDRDSRVLASGGDDGAVRLWDVRTRRQRGEPLRGHTGTVSGVAFSPRGRWLVSGGVDRTVRVWDVRRHRQVGAPRTGHGDDVNAVAFGGPGGQLLISAGADRTLRLWSLRPVARLGALPGGHGDDATSVAFSPDGRTLASAGSDSTVRLWDVRRRKPIGAPLRGHAKRVFGVAFGPDGHTLASAGSDRTIRLWDTRRRAPLGPPLTGSGGFVASVAFSPDGRLLASGGGDRAVRLWDVHARKQVGAPLRGHTDTVRSVAFGRGGRVLASASDDGTVALWGVRSRKRIAVLAANAGSAFAMAFSPDGRTLATGGVDRTVRLWDVRTRRQVGLPLTGHADSIFGLAFDRHGRTLASASYDRTVRLWDVPTRRQLLAPFDVGGPAWSVAFSPDGRTLASADGAGRVSVWNGLLWNRLGEVADEVCALVGRSLSRGDAGAYGGSDLVPGRGDRCAAGG